MADNKESTKIEDSNTVTIKREYFLPEYGFTVEAETIEAAEELAKKRIKQEQAA